MYPNLADIDPKDDTAMAPDIELAVHGACRNEVAVIGVKFEGAEWQDLNLCEKAIARAIHVAPKDYNIFLATNCEKAANTVNLCLEERDKNGETSSTYPVGMLRANTEHLSHDNVLRRILQAVQTREREHCHVHIMYVGKDASAQASVMRAKSLAEAAFEEEAHQEKEKKRKRRKGRDPFSASDSSSMEDE